MNKENEEKPYVDYDEDSGMWCIFREDFALASFLDKEEAEEYLSNYL